MFLAFVFVKLLAIGNHVRYHEGGREGFGCPNLRGFVRFVVKKGFPIEWRLCGVGSFAVKIVSLEAGT